jgi:DNA-binding NtrC family response regulator
MVDEGSFRADLLYRLEVVRIDVPPLADRREDIPELAEHLLADVRERYQLPARRLSVEALDALSRRSFPGNVRELRHVLARAALAATDTFIVPADLPPEPVRAEASAAVAPVVEEDGHAERADSIRRALRATAGHRGKAAERLGISKSTFYRYLETYGIDLEEFKAPKRAS